MLSSLSPKEARLEQDSSQMADAEVTSSPSKPIAIQRKTGPDGTSPTTASSRQPPPKQYRKSQPANQQRPPTAPQAAEIRYHRQRQEAQRPPLKLSDPTAWPTPEATRHQSPKAKPPSMAGTRQSRQSGGVAQGQRSPRSPMEGSMSSGSSVADGGSPSSQGTVGGMVGMRLGSLDSIQTQEHLVPDSLSIDIMSVSSALSNDIQSLSDSDADSSEAYPDGTMTRCSTPSQEGRETVATESSSLPDNISLSLLTQEPRSADAIDNEHGGSEPSCMERRLDQRQKQIDYGKNTEGYARYTRLVPKTKRKRGDPQTPDKYATYSKRAWDGLVRVWRRKLHAWDPPGLPLSASHVAKLHRQAQQAAQAAALADEHNRIHGLEDGEIPQRPTFASIVGSPVLSFQRKLPFAATVPLISTAEHVAIGDIPVVTAVVEESPKSASEEELDIMTKKLKSMLIPSEESSASEAIEIDEQETTVNEEAVSELPPLPVQEEVLATEPAPEEKETATEETELAFVANHAAPPSPLVAALETRAVAMVRSASPPLRSPMSIRSFNWADDADAEVDWEVEEFEIHEESGTPLTFEDKDCIEPELEDGEIVE